MEDAYSLPLFERQAPPNGYPHAPVESVHHRLDSFWDALTMKPKASHIGDSPSLKMTKKRSANNTDPILVCLIPYPKQALAGEVYLASLCPSLALQLSAEHGFEGTGYETISFGFV